MDHEEHQVSKDNQVRREPKVILDHQGQLVPLDQRGYQDHVVTLDHLTHQEIRDIEDHLGHMDHQDRPDRQDQQDRKDRKDHAGLLGQMDRENHMVRRVHMVCKECKECKACKACKECKACRACRACRDRKEPRASENDEDSSLPATLLIELRYTSPFADTRFTTCVDLLHMLAQQRIVPDR